MANLSVRQLDEEVYLQLRERASIHGVSMEEEVRQILTEAVHTPVSIAAVFQKHFGKKGVKLKIVRHKKPHDPIEM